MNESRSTKVGQNHELPKSEEGNPINGVKGFMEVQFEKKGWEVHMGAAVASS